MTRPAQLPLTRRRFQHLLAGGAATWAAGAATGARSTTEALTAASPLPSPLPQPLPSLDSLARAKGLRFGTALGVLPSGARRTSRFQDLAYRDLVAHECSVLVAENETKWPQLRPDPAQPYDFGPADEMFAWGKARGMALRGHTLVWVEPKWLPPWLEAVDFGARPAQAMEKLLAEHVATVCGHFGRDIESWDVVNEAIDPASGAIRANRFTQTLGAVPHLARMFELAAEHAPHAELVYNDFMSWGADNAHHRAGVLRLLADLKARGAPVRALGVQAHIGVWQLPPGPGAAAIAEWRRFLDEVAGMGLNILVTEFDVNDQALPGDVAVRDAGVASLARDWLDVTLAQPRLNRLLCWGLADHHSWLQDFAPRGDGVAKRVLPYDEALRAKPLREAIAGALRAMPARPAA